MPQGYEVTNANGDRAWWDGKKLTPLDARGYQMKTPPPAGGAAAIDQNVFRRAQDSVQAIDKAKGRTGFWTTGLVGGFLADKVRGSSAYNLDKDLDTLKARTAFDELAAMRRSSPTGGALGAVSERELALLQASEANLDVGQSKDQLDKNLDRMRGTITSRNPGVSASNPFALTEANRATIPEGGFFKAGDGKVYRQQKGAGFPGKGGRPGGAAAMSDDEIKRQLGL